MQCRTELKTLKSTLNSCDHHITQAFYTASLLPKMRPHQKLVVMMGLFADANVSAAGSVAQQEVALVPTPPENSTMYVLQIPEFAPAFLM